MSDVGFVYKDFRDRQHLFVIDCPCSEDDIVIHKSKEIITIDQVRFCPNCGKKLRFSQY